MLTEVKEIKYKSYVPIALFVVLVVLSYLILKPLLLAVFVGALLAYAFHPLYKYLLKKSDKPVLWSFVICFLVLLIIIIPAFFLIKGLVQESYFLYSLFKQKIAEGLFKGCTSSFCETIARFSQDQAITSQLKSMLKASTDWIILRSTSFLVNLPRLLINLFVVFFTLFFFIKDGEVLVRKFQKYLQLRQKNFTFLLTRFKEIMRGIVYGYLLVALIQGFFGAVGFFLFGISSPLFWGSMMAFFALIPAIGTGIIWVPASLLLILDGVFQSSTPLIIKGVGLLVYCFIFVGSIDNIVRPKVMGEKARVHTAIVMLGIFGGILFIGPLGVIFGPLVLSLTAEILKMLLSDGKSLKTE